MAAREAILREPLRSTEYVLTMPAPTRRIGHPNAITDRKEDDMQVRAALLAPAGLLAALAVSSPPAAQEMCPDETYPAESDPLDDYGFVTSTPAASPPWTSRATASPRRSTGGQLPVRRTSDQEQYNWATSDTNGLSFCAAGPDGVYSQAERIECLRGSVINRAVPNHAESGAQMLLDFVNAGHGHPRYLSAQPAPRYVPVLLGHNDVCGGQGAEVPARLRAGQRPGPEQPLPDDAGRLRAGAAQGPGHPHHDPGDAHRRGRDGARDRAVQPRRTSRTARHS